MKPGERQERFILTLGGTGEKTPSRAKWQKGGTASGAGHGRYLLRPYREGRKRIGGKGRDAICVCSEEHGVAWERLSDDGHRRLAAARAKSEVGSAYSRPTY